MSGKNEKMDAERRKGRRRGREKKKSTHPWQAIEQAAQTAP